MGKNSLRTALIGTAVAAFATPASAIPVISDWLNVYDGHKTLVESAILDEHGENAGSIVALSVAIDPGQFGNATVLREPNGQDSDIFGICTCGVGGALALGFASDEEGHGVSFGVFARTFKENAFRYDATLYLAPDLQARGWTAFFSSDAPEPGSWAMMIAGFGLVGAALRRRVPVAATA